MAGGCPYMGLTITRKPEPEPHTGPAVCDAKAKTVNEVLQWSREHEEDCRNANAIPEQARYFL